MSTLILTTTILHVLAGTIALLVGLVSMVAKKGAKLHNRSGIIYVWCMITVAVTALMMCGLQPFKMLRLFLTGIAVFSFYLCVTGWRATKQKKSGPARGDKILTYVTLLVSLTMMGFGLYLMALNGLNFFPIVFLFFGFLTFTFARQDYVQFRQSAENIRREVAPWFFQHIARMGGSYIATFTAFLVNNMYRMLPDNSPEWVATLGWIAPSLIGGMLITRTIKHYKSKFDQRKKSVVTRNAEPLIG